MQSALAALNLQDACLSDVSNYLTSRVRSWIDSKTLVLPLQVNGTRFDLSYFPERDSASALASKLCTQYAARNEGLTEENFYSACVNPVVTYLQQVTDSWIRERTIDISVDLNGKNFKGVRDYLSTLSSFILLSSMVEQ